MATDGDSGLHEAARANTSTNAGAGYCGPCGGPCNGACKFKVGEGTTAKGGAAVHADFPKAADPKPFKVGQGG